LSQEQEWQTIMILLTCMQ